VIQVVRLFPAVRAILRADRRNLTLAAIFLLVSQFGLSSSRLRERLGVGPTLIQLPLADLLARGCAECHYQASVRSDSLVDDAVWSEPLSQENFPAIREKYRETPHF
jgi:hypothetical protein